MSQQAHETIWQQIKSQLDTNPEITFDHVLIELEKSGQAAMEKSGKNEQIVGYGIWTAANVLKQAYEHFKAQQ